MKFSIYGWYFLPYVKKYLEKDGHTVILNNFSTDVDVCIAENIMYMYDVYINLKKIKKNKIKLINIIADIPLFELQKDYLENTFVKDMKQNLFNMTHRNQFLLNFVNYYKPSPKKGKIFNSFSARVQNYLNFRVRNAFYHQRNYRRYLMKSDLVLSMSKYTKFIVKKFLKLNTDVYYGCINSDYLSKLPKVNIEYDAINISRIVPEKRQKLFVKAAKKLGLNVIVIGYHQDKSIILDCPHFKLENQEEVFDYLNKSRFYVAPSVFEGFGMTPLEAAFLDKICISSDTYVNREILKDYPLYFKRDNLDDLVEKMQIVLNSGFKLNNEYIKKKYSIEASKNRLMGFVESLF